MNSRGDGSEALDALVARQARYLRRLEELQAIVDRELAALRDEAEGIMAQLRALMPEDLEGGDGGTNRPPHVSIPDDRLRRVWLSLYRYPGGETADVIARDLNRHRTTISTYLNTLVLMGFAEKKRRSHEILYTAIVKTDRAES